MSQTHVSVKTVFYFQNEALPGLLTCKGKLVVNSRGIRFKPNFLCKRKLNLNIYSQHIVDVSALSIPLDEWQPQTKANRGSPDTLFFIQFYVRLPEEPETQEVPKTISFRLFEKDDLTDVIEIAIDRGKSGHPEDKSRIPFFSMDIFEIIGSDLAQEKLGWEVPENDASMAVPKYLSDGIPSKSLTFDEQDKQSLIFLADCPMLNPSQCTQWPWILDLILLGSLRPFLPIEVRFLPVSLIFSPQVHGSSSLSFYRLVEECPYSKYTLLLIEDTNGSVYGCYANSPWVNSNRFYGFSNEVFVFRILEGQVQKFPIRVDPCRNIFANSEFLSMGGDLSFTISENFTLFSSVAGGAKFNLPESLIQGSPAKEIKIKQMELWGFQKD